MKANQITAPNANALEALEVFSIIDLIEMYDNWSDVRDHLLRVKDNYKAVTWGFRGNNMFYVCSKSDTTSRGNLVQFVIE